MSSPLTFNDSVGTMDQVDRTTYPFTSRWHELQPGKMHYADEETGEPLVFVHGTPMWSFEWRNLIRAFAPTHCCIAPDCIGFGLSERPRTFLIHLKPMRNTSLRSSRDSGMEIKASSRLTFTASIWSVSPTAGRMRTCCGHWQKRSWERAATTILYGSNAGSCMGDQPSSYGG
jgi:pimeloyl-ACP methyl ester carboxylesterase